MSTPGAGVNPGGIGAPAFEVPTVSLTALNQVLDVEIPTGFNQIYFNVIGVSAVLTVSFEQTFDGTNWTAINVQNTNTTTPGAGASITNPGGTPGGVHRALIMGAKRVRARISAFTSGSITISARVIAGPVAQAVSDTEMALTGLADNMSFTSAPVVAAVQTVWNGASYERVRRNNASALHTSAARTTTQSTGDQTNLGGTGLLITLDITAQGAATGGLTVVIEGRDWANSTRYYTLLQGVQVTALGNYRYLVDPRVPSIANQIAQHPVPRIYRIRVLHADATSYTYSLSAEFVP